MRFYLPVFLLLLLLSSGCIQLPFGEKPKKAPVIIKPKEPPVKPAAPEKPPECKTNDDCDDKDKSTIDLCAGDKCYHEKIKGCIGEDDFCPEGCNWKTDIDCPKADLCQSDTDCNDNKPETTDTCSGEPKECSNSLILICKSADGACPSHCNWQTDTDCEKKDLCQEQSECDDNKPETIDTCAGVPKRCIHKPVDCQNGDGVCPAHCTFDTDRDCDDECKRHIDCYDRNALSKDVCILGKPNKCTYDLQTISCISNDANCPQGCLPGDDFDCSCVADSNKFCPWHCAISDDPDCVTTGLCEKDSDCPKHFYATAKCTGNPKKCSYTFVNGTNCGSFQVGKTPDNLVDKEAANCFCQSINKCADSKLRAIYSDQTQLDLEFTDISTNFCKLAINVEQYEGKTSGEPVNFNATCSHLNDVNSTKPLRESLLIDTNCFSSLSTYLDHFPEDINRSLLNCSGNFVEWWKKNK